MLKNMKIMKAMMKESEIIDKIRTTILELFDSIDFMKIVNIKSESRIGIGEQSRSPWGG